MNHQNTLKAKIFNIEQLVQQIEHWKLDNKKIVFSNGCFDILHLGHIDYLSKAADLGDILIIGLNSDHSIQQIKGPSRPIISEESRIHLIASLFFVDAVILFDDETPYHLIQHVQPDILVKGNDYKAEEVVGYDIVTSRGGKVITIDLVEGYSTSAIINKILSK